jgi:hypothetical protein
MHIGPFSQLFHVSNAKVELLTARYCPLGMLPYRARDGYLHVQGTFYLQLQGSDRSVETRGPNVATVDADSGLHIANSGL